MGLLKRLSNLFSQPGRIDDPAYWITVRCNRCGETIRARVDMRNDLSLDYGESGPYEGQTTYFCRKMLMGEQGCFQQIEVELTYDANRKLLDRQIKGGQFIDEE